MGLDYSLTEDRFTIPTFDPVDFVTSEQAYSMARSRSEIKPDSLTNVHQLAAGGWALVPVQFQAANTADLTTGAGAVVTSSNFSAMSGVVTRNAGRSDADLTGATDGTSVSLSTSGNTVIVREVTDGNSFNNPTFAADQASFPPPISPTSPALSPVPVSQTTSYALDRWLVGTVNYQANQGFGLRFHIPGHGFNASDTHGAFYFGGPNFSPGGGEFAYSWSGDGQSYLYCRMPDGTDSGTIVWWLVDTWRHGPPNLAGNSQHNVSIMPLPYSGSSMPGIEFRHGPPGSTSSIGASGQNPYSPPDHGAINHRFTFIEMLGIIAAQKVASTELARVKADIAKLSQATAPGPIRLDMRRNVTAPVQITRLTHPLTGNLQDKPFSIEGPISGNNSLTIQWSESTLSPGCTVQGAIYDATTGTVCTYVSSGPTFAVYKSNPQSNAYYAIFNFGTSDENITPILWAYRVYKDASLQTTRATPWTGGQLVHFSGVGAGKDADTESWTLSFEDPAYELSLLQQRGDVPVEVTLQDSQGTVITQLARGNCSTSPGERWGTNQGLIYPTDLAQAVEAIVMPRCQRLMSAYIPNRIFLASDPNAMPQPDGTPTPFKVTDMLRAAPLYAGFPSYMIDVPDDGIRFWPLPGGSEDALWIAPLTNVWEWIVKTAADYLGWYWVWDGNAGAYGMWRCLPPAQPVLGSYVPVWNFVSQFEAGMTNTSEIMGSMRKWTKKPEANCVLVVGLAPEGGSIVKSFLANDQAVDIFTDSMGVIQNTANQFSPDYTDGSIRPITVIDPGITGRTTAEAQAACDAFCSRIFDYTCHGIPMTAFQTPLPLVLTTDPLQNRLRPLRYYDPVTVDNDLYFVSTSHVDYDTDAFQMATMELQSSTLLLPSDSMATYREWLKRHTLGHTGQPKEPTNRNSKIYAPGMKSNQHQSAIMALPVDASASRPLQIQVPGATLGQRFHLPDIDGGDEGEAD